jgi:hypothetical protein
MRETEALPDWATDAVIAAEQNLIGALMIGAQYADVAHLVRSEDFSLRHGLIVSAIATLASNGQPHNAVAVSAQLESTHHLVAAGGIAYLSELARTTLSTDGVACARAVRDHAIRRRLPAGFQDSNSISTLKRLLADLDALYAPDRPVPDRLRMEDLTIFVQRPDVRWLVRWVLTPESIMVVFGSPKGGKTFSVVDLMMHAAHGIDWQGCTVSRPLRVAFLAGEGRTGLKVRLRGWLEHHDTATLHDGGDFQLVPVSFPLPDHVDELIELLRDFKPDVVVIDTLNAYFGSGDENSTQDMTAFVTATRKLRDSLSCSVVVLHHTPLADATRERGSGVLRAAADVVVQIDRDEGGRGGIGFQVVTARDFEAMEAPIPLRLERVETDWQDEDGEAMVSCLVVAADGPVTLPGRTVRQLGPQQEKVLSCARQVARGQHPTMPDGTKVCVGKREIAAAAQAQGVSAQNVSNAWKSLEARGELRVTGPGTVEVTL